MELKHTPGPWYINTAGSAKKGETFKVTEIFVYAPHVQDDTAICADIIDPVTQEPSEANANLIAAAPDLLAALYGCYKVMLSNGLDECDEHDAAAAAAAIAKATGAA